MSDQKEFIHIEIVLNGDEWQKFVELCKVEGTRFESMVGKLIKDYVGKYEWEDIRQMKEKAGLNWWE